MNKLIVSQNSTQCQLNVNITSLEQVFHSDSVLKFCPVHKKNVAFIKTVRYCPFYNRCKVSKF